MGEVIPTAKAQRWEPAEVVRALLAEESAGRDAANLRTRRTRAAFPTGKTCHIWNQEASSIPIPTQSALRTLEWVGRRENLCVVGPSGTGKSHFCEALGQAAVDAGTTVAWFTIEDLGALVRRHRVDDSVSKAIGRITRTDLIIVDDIGLLPVSPDAAEGFYQRQPPPRRDHHRPRRRPTRLTPQLGRSTVHRGHSPSASGEINSPPPGNSYCPLTLFPAPRFRRARSAETRTGSAVF